ncbi:uncharacterized protein UBRO_20306 [Ustilago bromivora]|uniref:Uncharacterized protein n=1 Tax=Ustilago bromivora TaxID=307758 RepID=A0A1K0H8S1_9BASI|nr:uncharacterized protein UBRO_20306 [Ustilago bromivora]
MQPKERGIQPTDGRAEEAECSIWAFHSTNSGDHKGGSKPEGVGLRCWEEKEGIVILPGEGDSEGCSDDLVVPGTKGQGPELLQDGPKEWESNGQFGHCQSEAMGMFDATDRMLQGAVVETIKVEAEIDMPGSQGVKLVLDAVEGAGPSQVADPLSEEQVRGQEQ